MLANNKIAIVSFYSFVTIENPENLLPKILLIGKKKYIKGTVLLAEEGFNGTFSGAEENVNLVIDEIIKLTKAESVNVKVNYDEDHPFNRLKVKIKPEIISMKKGQVDVASQKGEYIDSEDWDEFIEQDNVLVVDTRNTYEIEAGTFKGAINPSTNTFKEFPSWVQANQALLQNKKIAMYCTGGVRCEKSTAYLKSLGYKEVYHLKGGILQYLQDTGNKNKKWIGECFVFDDRRGVDNNLKPSLGNAQHNN